MAAAPSSRPLNPRRLDVAAIAEGSVELQGTWALSEMTRLLQDGEPMPDPHIRVSWAIRGRLRPVRGGQPEVWLELKARADVTRVCQRCLHPVSLPISVDRAIRFVGDEAQAAALDTDSEEDVLALTHSLDLMELVEDEILLDLPLVPRHEECPLPSTVAGLAQEVQEAEPREHPFAALAALRRGKLPD